MTPLSRELQSLKEAASAATAVESAARALSARIFVECGQGGWLAMAREFSAIHASMALPEERYAAEIAALSGTSPAMDRLIEEVRHKDAAIREALRILCAEPFDRNNINDAVVRLTCATTAQAWAEGW